MRKQTVAKKNKSEKKLRVLMLTSSYPIKGSNLGPFIRNIVKALVKKNVQVGVMIFSTDKKYKEYKQDGATIYEYPYTKLFTPMLHKGRGLIPSVKKGIVPKMELIGYTINTIKYLKKIAKDYDVIHAHWLIPSGFLACLVKNQINKPIITTVWGAELHLKPNLFVNMLLNYVNNKSDIVITPAEYMKERAVLYGLNTQKMQIIPNSTDLKMFSLKRKKTNKIIIGTARRLVPEKRVQDLIIAYSYLKEEIVNNSELWILGDGPEMDDLQKMSNKLGCKDKIKFLGMVNHDQIPKYFSKIDIMVNPSIQESMATITIEAMAAGCVMIATDGCGNDEVITNNKDGFLYKGKDTKEIGDPMKPISFGFWVAAITSVIGFGAVNYFYLTDPATGNPDWRFFFATLTGIILAIIIEFITNYFTSTEKRPVKETANATKTGPATTILT